MYFERLAKLIAEHVGVDVSVITPETTFEELGIDSLDTVELVMDLEEELGTEIELDEKLYTVGELDKFIEKKLGNAE